ncbi:hypothetical protein LZ32DRAFT_541477, partial [Colletotrichum eremochloae]
VLLAKHASINVTLWSLIIACLETCKNYVGLLVCCFLLSVFKAAVVLPWVLFNSQWYTK